MKAARVATAATICTLLVITFSATVFLAGPVSAAATTYSTSGSTGRYTCPLCTESISTNTTSASYSYSSTYSSSDSSYGSGSLSIGDSGLAVLAASSLLVAFIALAMRRKGVAKV